MSKPIWIIILLSVLLLTCKRTFIEQASSSTKASDPSTEIIEVITAGYLSGGIHSQPIKVSSWNKDDLLKNQGKMFCYGLWANPGQNKDNIEFHPVFYQINNYEKCYVPGQVKTKVKREDALILDFKDQKHFLLYSPLIESISLFYQNIEIGTLEEDANQHTLLVEQTLNRLTGKSGPFTGYDSLKGDICYSSCICAYEPTVPNTFQENLLMESIFITLKPGAFLPTFLIIMKDRLQLQFSMRVMKYWILFNLIFKKVCFRRIAL